MKKQKSRVEYYNYSETLEMKPPTSKLTFTQIFSLPLLGMQASAMKSPSYRKRRPMNRAFERSEKSDLSDAAL